MFNSILDFKENISHITEYQVGIFCKVHSRPVLGIKVKLASLSIIIRGYKVLFLHPDIHTEELTEGGLLSNELFLQTMALVELFQSFLIIGRACTLVKVAKKAQKGPSIVKSLLVDESPHHVERWRFIFKKYWTCAGVKKSGIDSLYSLAYLSNLEP